MRTTIDKAGRVVIPASIRALAHLEPGSELEVTVDELGVRLSRAVPGPRIERVGSRFVARPSVPVEQRPAIDVAKLVDVERERWPW